MRHVGDALGLEEAAGVAQVRMQNVRALMQDEVEESFAAGEVLAHANRHLRYFGQPFPRIGVLNRQRIFEPDGFRIGERVREIYRCPYVPAPLTVNHEVAVPADRFSNVVEALLNVDQLTRTQSAWSAGGIEATVFTATRRPAAISTAGVARSAPGTALAGRIRLNAELMAGETALGALNFSRPICACCLI